MGHTDAPDRHFIEAAWRQTRPRLVDIGYRMLGSMAEATDVADEACTRLLAADHDAVDDVTGWLVTVTGRLCIDRLRSADRSRRAYVGPWLPEPVLRLPDPSAVDPADRVTLDDSIRLALLVVLEQLSPAERTSLVLHDFFAYSFDEVATIVGRSPDACRQLASRARRKVQADPETPPGDVDHDELERVARHFADACSAGRIEPLLEVLDPDVVGDFDSGGVVPGAPLTAIVGAPPVARVLRHAFLDSGFRFTVEDVNGLPGVVVWRGDRLVAVTALGARDGRVSVLHAVGNPDKLRHLGPTWDGST